MLSEYLSSLAALARSFQKKFDDSLCASPVNVLPLVHQISHDSQAEDTKNSARQFVARKLCGQFRAALRLFDQPMNQLEIPLPFLQIIEIRRQFARTRERRRKGNPHQIPVLLQELEHGTEDGYQLRFQRPLALGG